MIASLLTVTPAGSAHAPVPLPLKREADQTECPCVVALPIAAGNPQYLDWIAAETRPA